MGRWWQRVWPFRSSKSRGSPIDPRLLSLVNDHGTVPVDSQVAPSSAANPQRQVKRLGDVIDITDCIETEPHDVDVDAPDVDDVDVDDLDMSVLEEIERRVLWLACRMVDYANHDRPNVDGMKVGGHQASSASMVTLMTALWFSHLGHRDRVAVKPHASPVFHAIQYLLGDLDAEYLTTLRELGGLQAYPSRTKDPDHVDFSTGSVGLGAAAPLFGAVARRYVDSHFETGRTAANEDEFGRFIAVLGDAELDEGNVWEAIADPVTQGLGNVMWVVDLNRQSLDRVIPGIKAARLERMFEDNGWHVIEAKYGRRLQSQFARPGGQALRRHIDDMSNEEYQSLFAYEGAELRSRFCAGASQAVVDVLAPVNDADLAALVQNLGGHDIGELQRAFREADAETHRPSVVFAYTVKGWGLPIAGDPLNHSKLLTRDQMAELREGVGLTPQTEWDRFTPDSPPGALCERVGKELRLDRQEVHAPPVIAFPLEVALPTLRKPTSTQEHFGRLLTRLSENTDLADRLVTTSPDVAVSTNLGGWINKVGVFSDAVQHDYFDAEQLVRWRPSPEGKHIELGISEMNLFLLLGQLGLTNELSGELLLPIGTVYDPFVLRGLDALIYGLYCGARFIVVGTPSGTTLSYEGGAHQSSATASTGLELPGLTLAEPAYGAALDWLLCDGLSRLADRETGESSYLRLTTRPIDQAPFELARERFGDEELRRQVLGGGYRLVDGADEMPDAPVVQLMASGAVMPEVLSAATALADEGVAANVIDVTSLSRLYHSWRSSRRNDLRGARSARDKFPLAELLPQAERSAPIVTVHDASSHAMAWLGSVYGAPVVPIGVDEFGQSGSLGDVQATFDIDAESIVNAALVALDLSKRLRQFRAKPG